MFLPPFLLVEMLSPFQTFFLLFALFYFSPFTNSLPQSPLQQTFLLSSSECNEKCGKLQIPFPFHLSTSCTSISTAFHLSCSNSTTLFLTIQSQKYRVIQFFSDGILVDFPDISACRHYNDLNSFGFSGNSYFGISVDNVIGLYDCEDLSLCKASCETNDLPDCNGNSSPDCCYPLSDQTQWDSGDGFSVFSKFGCRGFSCWVVPGGANAGKRGVKLEWAVPSNSSKGACDANATSVTSLTVEEGIRCKCQDGFVGDGFIAGTGCLKSCTKDGREVHGSDCDIKRHHGGGTTVTILAGVLGPVFIIVSLVMLFCILKTPATTETFEVDQARYHSAVSFRKACRTRLFTYSELEEATKGFHCSQKLVESNNGNIYAGVLGDGSHVAVQKVVCQDEMDLIQVLSRIKFLSAVLHRNMARLIGCCIDSGYTPLVVYEYPANGTLEEHLKKHSREQKVGLDWYKRLSIAAETASVLAFLQYDNRSPPIFHQDLKTGYIFLEDEDLSVKLAGFKLSNNNTFLANETQPYNNFGSSCIHPKNDVSDFGMLLLELITGSKNKELPASAALQKIRSGKLEEIVDPGLYYHEQPPFRREQMEVVADLATRCLLFGGDGKIGMIEVCKELGHITKDSIDGGSKRGPALEETFSNSSLLQMISLSPDSIYAP